MPAAIDAISTAPETTTLSPGCMSEMLFRRLVAAHDPTVIRALLTLFQYNNWGASVPVDAGCSLNNRRVEKRL
eukprot:6117398-Prymnesium_polylepis.1